MYIICTMCSSTFPYSVTFSDTTGTTFRGMLVVSENSAGTRGGTFAPGADTQRTCSVSHSHTAHMQIDGYLFMQLVIYIGVSITKYNLSLRHSCYCLGFKRNHPCEWS